MSPIQDSLTRAFASLVLTLGLTAASAEATLEALVDRLDAIRDEISAGNRRTQLSIAGSSLVLAGILAGGLLNTQLPVDPLWLTGGVSGVGLLLLAWAQWR